MLIRGHVIDGDGDRRRHPSRIVDIQTWQGDRSGDPRSVGGDADRPSRIETNRVGGRPDQPVESVGSGRQPVDDECRIGRAQSFHGQSGCRRRHSGGGLAGAALEIEFATRDGGQDVGPRGEDVEGGAVV